MKNRIAGLALLCLMGPLAGMAQDAPPAPPALSLDVERTFPQREAEEWFRELGRRGIPFEIDVRMTIKCNGTGLCSTIVRPSGLPLNTDRERRACVERCSGRTGDALTQCLALCPPVR